MSRYKVAMLGDYGVGKTALVCQLCYGSFIEQYDPSILEFFPTKVIVDDESYVLEIVDRGGQEDDLCLEIQSSDGFVLVYDTNSRSSFSRVEEFADQIQHMKKNFAPPSQPTEAPNPVPRILVGNKCDLGRKEVSSKEGQKLAKTLDCKFVETSAKKDQNVTEAFVSLTRTLKMVKKDVQTTVVEDSLLPRLVAELLGLCFGFDKYGY